MSEKKISIEELLEIQNKQFEKVIALLQSQKKVMTMNEVAEYTGMSKSTLYKLTSQAKIKHFCPNGKIIFFKLEDVHNYLLQNEVSAMNETDNDVTDYLKH